MLLLHPRLSLTKKKGNNPPRKAGPKARRPALPKVNPPTPDVSSVHSGVEDQPDEPSPEHHMSNDEVIPHSGTESASASSHKKKKQKQPRKQTDLSDDDKEAIKEWLKVNQVIYNKRLHDFRDTEKKFGLWAELAKRLGRSVDELTTFYDTARTNMSRAKRMYRSGMSQDQFKITLNWYWERFQFLLPHISDVKTRNVASFTATFGAAASTTTTSSSNPIAVPCISSATTMSLPPDADALSDVVSDTSSVPVSVTGSSVTPAATAAPKGGDRSVIETMLVDLLKDKSTNMPPFTSYLNERLEGLDPHHRRVAERRLMQVLDQVEQEQEQSRAPSLPPTFNPYQQNWQGQGPLPHGPSWSQQPQFDAWQGWQPHPSQWQPPTGSQATIWGSQNAAWIDSQYPTQSTSAAAVGATTTTSTPARPSSSTSTAAAPLTTDDGTTFTVVHIPGGKVMSQIDSHEAITMLGNESFNTLLGALSTPDKAATTTRPDDKQDQ